MHWNYIKHTRGGRPLSTPIYKPYVYVPAQRVWFLGIFGLKIGYGLELGMVFEGTTGVYEGIYREFQMNKKGIEVCKLEMHLKKFFACALIEVIIT